MVARTDLSCPVLTALTPGEFDRRDADGGGLPLDAAGDAGQEAEQEDVRGVAGEKAWHVMRCNHITCQGAGEPIRG